MTCCVQVTVGVVCWVYGDEEAQSGTEAGDTED